MYFGAVNHYLIMIIKQTLIGTETVLKSSSVLSDVDDELSAWLSLLFWPSITDFDLVDSDDIELFSSSSSNSES